MQKRKNLNGLYRNKRANIFLESITIIVFLIAFVTITFFSFQLYQTIMPQINETVSSSAEAVQVLNTINTRYPAWLDGAIAFAFAGLWMAALIAAFRINAHPIFFVITIILLIFSCFVAIILANTYDTLFTDLTFNMQFPMTNFIISNILAITIAIGVSIGVALFGKMVVR